MRLFVAVRPPDPVLLHLDRAVAGVRDLADGAGVRWTAPENLHLTLAFFGEVPDGALGELTSGLDGVVAGADPFEIGLRGAGVFGGRTLWVGATGEVESMVRLAAAARTAGESVSRFRDERPRLRPHLTIGRLPPARSSGRPGARSAGSGRGRGASRPSAEADHLVRALAVYEGPRWSVAQTLLVSSVPGAGRGGGPRYETVRRMPLGAVAG